MPISNNILAGSGQSSADLGEPIDQSLRFRAGSSTYGGHLSRAITTSSTTAALTISFWVKVGNIPSGYNRFIFSSGTAGTASGNISYINASGESYIRFQDTSTINTEKLRDHSAWYHIVYRFDAANQFEKVYVNGIEHSSASIATSARTDFGKTSPMQIGRYADSNYGNNYFDGYLAEWNMLFGTSLGPDSFGRTNEDGVWVPISLSDLTSNQYGALGNRLVFDSSAGLGDDTAPTGGTHASANDFTASGFDTAAISSSNPDNDVDFFDTPTSNYATLNPLDGSPYNDTTRLKAANLEHNSTYWGTATHNKVNRPILPGDKLYIEIYVIRRQTSPNILYPHFQFEQVGTYTSRSQYADGTGYFSGVDAWPTGSVIRLKLNGDNQTIQIAVDNGSFTSDLNLNFTGPFTVRMTNTDSACQYNFGQMPFVYSVPTGYTAMSTDNLPEPTIKNGSEHVQVITGPGNAAGVIWKENTITSSNPTDSLALTTELGPWNSTATYNATPYNASYTLVLGVAVNSLTFRLPSGFGSNAVCYVSEDGTTWRLFDDGGTYTPTTATGWPALTNFTVNDGTPIKYLRWMGFNQSLNCGIQDPIGQGDLLSTAQNTFSDGFWWIKDRATNSTNWQYVSNIGGTQRVTKSPAATGAYNSGTYPSYSAPTSDSIAYCWKYDSSDPTINGFEMKTNVGDGSTTISHNLGKAPDFIMAFPGRMDLPFSVYHSAVPGERNIWSSDQWYADGWWGSNSDFTNTTFGVQSNNSYVNPTGYTNLYFLWTAVEGYSSFGKYNGNSSTDNAFVYCGFKPAIVLLKATNGTSDWILHNTTVSTSNPSTNFLSPNNSLGETTGFDIDILSNGFKIRSANGPTGTSTDVIYCAWAESPFGGENTPPATAR